MNWLVDGVSNVDVGSNITLLSTPTLESIQEFKIITSSYAAEWPRSGGGVVNVVTKSGTSKFTGSAYEFCRDDKLNANSWFRETEHEPRRQRQRRRRSTTTTSATPSAARCRCKDKAVLLLVAGVAAHHARAGLADAERARPDWLTDPTNTNYVAPALRDPNAVKLLAPVPGAEPGPAQRTASTLRRVLAEHQQHAAGSHPHRLRPVAQVAAHRPLHARPERDARAAAACSVGIAFPNVATTDTNVPGPGLRAAA